jgi:hypothetical protein
MGTSRNDPSPNTPPWRPALAAVGHQSIPPERQEAEIWRAASAERETQLVDDLGHPVLSAAASIAAEKLGVLESLTRFDELVRSQDDARFAFDMGRRALARAASRQAGREGFAAELFAEATSYYVSRDLPTALGRPGYIETASAAIDLTDRIRTSVRERVRTAGAPPPTAEQWRPYVRGVLSILRGERPLR